MALFLLIKQIFQKILNLIAGLFYYIYNYSTSVLIMSFGVYSALFFLGINFGFIQTLFILSISFFLNYTGLQSFIPFLEMTGYLKWKYIMDNPHLIGAEHLSPNSEESRIVHEITSELGIKMPYVLVQLNDEGKTDIPLSNLNAFAWFNSIIVQGFDNVDTETKRFILGHEIGHIYKKHCISAHLDELLETIYFNLKELLTKTFSFEFDKFSIIGKAMITFFLFEYYHKVNHLSGELLINQIINDSKYLLNLIPAYLSLDIARMLMKWSFRQQEYSCDNFSLTAIPEENIINKTLKGGDKTFNHFYAEGMKSFYKRWIAIIYDNHPNPYSRFRSLNYRYKSYFLHTGMTILRYMLVLIIFASINIFLAEKDISILNHKRTKELALTINQNLKNYWRLYDER